MSKLYVKFKIPETPEEFLVKFLFDESTAYFNPKPTYDNPDYTYIQCDAGKNRSVDDLYYLLNTYYKVSFKEMIHMLLTIQIQIIKNENIQNKLVFYLMFCDDTNLFVVSAHANYRFYSSLRDDDEIHSNEMSSSHSWYELITNELNITSSEEYNSYIKKHCQIFKLQK